MSLVPFAASVTTADQLVAAINAALAPLTSSIVTNFNIDTIKNAPFYGKNLYFEFGSDTSGATPLSAPFQVIQKSASSEAQVDLLLLQFIAANPTYFITGPFFIYRPENPDPNGAVTALLVYCADPAAANNWSGGGSVSPATGGAGTLPIGTTTMASVPEGAAGGGDWSILVQLGVLRYKTIVSVAHDGSTATLTETAPNPGPGIGVFPVTFDATVSGGNLNIQATTAVAGWSYVIRQLDILAVPASVSSPFKLSINTTLPGASPNTDFTLSLPGPQRAGPNLPVNFTINWGDGNQQVVVSNADLTHTYAVGGAYTLSIYENVAGGFPGCFFNGDGLDETKVTAIVQWGSNTWTYMAWAFQGCGNMVNLATDDTTAKTGTIASWEGAFAFCNHLTRFPVFDFSAATTIKFLMYGPAVPGSLPLTIPDGVNFPNATQAAQAWFGQSVIYIGDVDLSSAIDISYLLCVGIGGNPGIPLVSKLKRLGSANNFLFFASGATFVSSDFAIADLHSMSFGQAAWADAVLPVATYSAMLNNWAFGNIGLGIPANVNINVPLDVNAKYDASAVAARAYLVGTLGWTINDLGLV